MFMGVDGRTEEEIREDLLKVPDHVVIKEMGKYIQLLEQSNDNNKKIIDNFQALYLKTRKTNEILVDIIKEYCSHDAYLNIKKECKKRLKELDKIENGNPG